MADDNILNMVNNRKGVFGLGLTNNANLDLLNLIVLACAGIIIKIFFQENYTSFGNMGPASTTIWGYGLTAIALFMLKFMTLNANNEEMKILRPNDKESLDIFSYMKLFMTYTLPVTLTLGLIVYIIAINFIYFKRINSNRVADSYHTYSLISSILLIVQMGLIFKYLFTYIVSHKKSPDTKKEQENATVGNATYLLATINFIFVMITHILLAFFSTDG